MSAKSIPIQKVPVRYFGKYRGLVVGNVDPEQLGRVLLQVPAVLGTTVSSWAMPCVPAAGTQSGLFIVPPVGSSVWAEFEGGDASLPIWTGGFWADAAEVPVLATAPSVSAAGQNIVIQTQGQNTVALSDAAPTPASGGILLKSANGAMIVVNSSGIYIENGKGASIALVGPVVTVAGVFEQEANPAPAERRPSGGP